MTPAEIHSTWRGLLRCPACGASPELAENTPHCASCGYRAQPIPATQPAMPGLYDPIFELSWEVTRGWNTGRAFVHACMRRFFDSEGLVLDLGSGRSPSYARYLRPEPQLYVRADGSGAAQPDLLVDLEQPLPIRDEIADGVILMNVLEHVYRDRELLAEIHRVLKPGGKLYLYVPYLIRVHCWPCDYRRYTHYALARLLQELGFVHLETCVNAGFFRLIPAVYRKLGKIAVGYLLFPLTLGLFALDRLVDVMALGRLHQVLPRGYFVVARKP